MKGRFLGNIGNKKLHALDYTDGRCKIDGIKEENRVLFDSLEEGLAFPSKEEPALRKCGICIKKYEEAKKRG